VQKLVSLPFKSCQHKVPARSTRRAVRTLSPASHAAHATHAHADHNLRRAAVAQRRHPGLRLWRLAGALVDTQWRLFCGWRVRARQPEGESRPQKFSQVFHLMPAGASWFVFNDLFRLNYG